MFKTSLTLPELQMHVFTAAHRDTSSNPDGWTQRNPMWGHCAIVAAIVQKVFGGELLRYDLSGTKYAFMGSHYKNRLDDGTCVDFTENQFGVDRPLEGLEPIVRDRSYVLNVEKFPESVARYKRLFWRIMGAQYPKSAICNEEMFRECFFAALESDCAKMHFGCTFVHDGKVVHVDTNKKIPAIAHRCEPVCIREKITARTESMIGACHHAEEGLWEVANQGIPPKEVEMYVAGFYPDMTPWLKTKAEHTCIRCATAAHLAEVKAVHVPVVDHWETVDRLHMLDTSFAYALGEKKV